MVETAFVLLPLLALVCGSVDFCMVIFLKNTFQNATREGVRYAVTFRTKPGFCQDDSIRLVVQDFALGFLGNQSTPNPAIQVNYYDPSNLGTPVKGATANQPLNVVEVTTAGYQWNWITNLTGLVKPLNVVAYSSDRLGGLPGGSSPPCR